MTIKTLWHLGVLRGSTLDYFSQPLPLITSDFPRGKSLMADPRDYT